MAANHLRGTYYHTAALSAGVMIAVLVAAAAGLLRCDRRPSAPPRDYIVNAALSTHGRWVAAVLIGGSVPNPIQAPFILRLWKAGPTAIHPVEVRPLAEPPGHDFAVGLGTNWPGPLVMRFVEGGRDLVVLQPGAWILRVISREGLRDIKTVSMGYPPPFPHYAPVDMAVSPSGGDVAVLVTWAQASNAFMGYGQYAPVGEVIPSVIGGDVRIYSLRTGKLVWRRVFENVEMANVAWSPSGRRLAVTVLSRSGSRRQPVPGDIDNLLILNSSTGKTLEGISTGDFAGPVCFGPNDQVFTAPLHVTLGHWHNQKVSVWNAKTGKLVRQIGYKGRNVHEFLALSQDGRVLLGGIGTEMRDIEGDWGLHDQRFAVWNATTGALVETSPALGCPHSVSPIQVALSSDGSRALVYNGLCSGKHQIKVLDLPEIPAGRRAGHSTGRHQSPPPLVRRAQ